MLHKCCPFNHIQKAPLPRVYGTEEFIFLVNRSDGDLVGHSVDVDVDLFFHLQRFLDVVVDDGVVLDGDDTLLQSSLRRRVA